MLQQLPRRLVPDTLLLIALGFQRGFQPLFLFAAEPARLMRAIRRINQAAIPSSTAILSLQ
jgi:hypothetical protein